MSVLKPNGGDGRVVRPFRIGAATAAQSSTHEPVAVTQAAQASPSPAPTTSKPDERLALSRRIAELEQALAESAKKAETAAEQAREEGRKLGREEADKKDAERLATLAEAATKARADAVRALESQRSLAVDIARATLGQILGDQSAFAGMVGETAALWKTKLADTTILKLRVSGQDFTVGLALQDLQANVGNLEISVEDELPPGSCIFDLQLGEVDASLPLQAARADDVLSDYTQHGVAAE